MWLETTMVEIKAHKEGREPTPEEYEAAAKRAIGALRESARCQAEAMVALSRLNQPRRVPLLVIVGGMIGGLWILEMMAR